uniref:Uncharacterized protein n=1 Tax=Glossina palpalis gambiensis TaxID=67801 RepID=A0A1B0BET3_9MUSC
MVEVSIRDKQTKPDDSKTKVKTEAELYYKWFNESAVDSKHDVDDDKVVCREMVTTMTAMMVEPVSLHLCQHAMLAVLYMGCTINALFAAQVRRSTAADCLEKHIHGYAAKEDLI